MDDRRDNVDGLAQGGIPPNVTQQGQAGVDDHSSDIFFAAIETTRMPIILTDPNQSDNPIVFANHAFLQMTGYSSDDVVGKNCRFLQGPETDRETVAEIRRSIAQEEQVSVEILNYRKDGASFWNALYISPVYTRQKSLAYFFASQLDVSRRRDAEEALRQAQKMEAVGQLTGGIAHDFNNLLQVILGSLELFKRSAGFAPDSRNAKLLGAMDDAAGRARTLTQQLLAFSRKQKLEGRIVNVNRLIVDMQDLSSRSLGDAIEVVHEMQDDLWMARLDPSQGQMAILNIIVNARDAMPDGGRITIKTENIDLTGEGEMFDGLLPGRYISVAITDTGTGIPEPILKRVLDPFFTTKEEGKGTGLGLSMVYGFVKQSGGSIKIESEVGRGTTLRLLFPAAKSHEIPESLNNKRAIDKGGSESILVVDDRSDVALMACAMLEDAGYMTTTAANGQAALKLLEDGSRFALIFTDVIMPGGMNGVILGRKARQLQPQLKVLLTTGYAEATIERTDAGGDEFEMIAKPYARNDLVRKVRQVIDGPTGVS